MDFRVSLANAGELPITLEMQSSLDPKLAYFPNFL